MKLFNKIALLATSLVAATTFSACEDPNYQMHYPPQPEVKELSDNIHTFKAPLYWTVYEYCRAQEIAQAYPIDYTAEQWDQTIDWVARELLPYGYDMVCTDGFCAMLTRGDGLYMDTYGSMAIKDIIAKCQAKGLRLGVYDNPLWIHCDESRIIPGTNNITVGSLRYDASSDTDRSQVLHPETADKDFHWIMADHEGAKEYIDGFFKYYSTLGVKYIRMDFMSWYEDGKDNGSLVGHGYGSKSYSIALRYIAESAQRYGVFTSIVMPHLYKDALVESAYCNMTRIVCDALEGGWNHTSAWQRGYTVNEWPHAWNQFDGLTKWSHIAGKDKIILDPDFLMMHQYATDAEREFVISLCLMAGGPLTVADQPTTIGGHIRFYQNEEMLALNKDRFVGHPLSSEVNSEQSNTWYGQMSDGSYVVAFFNREERAVTRSLNFKTIGAEGEWQVRDLWKHADEGKMSSISVTLNAHSCKVVKLTK